MVEKTKQQVQTTRNPVLPLLRMLRIYPRLARRSERLGAGRTVEPTYDETIRFTFPGQKEEGETKAGKDSEKDGSLLNWPQGENVLGSITDNLLEKHKQMTMLIEYKTFEILESMGWDVEKLISFPLTKCVKADFVFYHVRSIIKMSEKRTDRSILDGANKIEQRPGYSLFYMASSIIDIVFLEARPPRGWFEKFMYGKRG